MQAVMLRYVVKSFGALQVLLLNEMAAAVCTASAYATVVQRAINCLLTV